MFGDDTRHEQLMTSRYWRVTYHTIINIIGNIIIVQAAVTTDSSLHVTGNGRIIRGCRGCCGASTTVTRIAPVHVYQWPLSLSPLARRGTGEYVTITNGGVAFGDAGY